MNPVARFLAEGINPLFVVLLLAAPLVGLRPGAARRTLPAWFVRRVLPFWLSSALGLALAVVLAETGKRLSIWPGHPGFPSGHETFALSCGTSLACWDVRWLWVAAPLAVLIGWALTAAGYHKPAEVVGALLTGPAPALVAQSWRLRRRG